MKIYLIYDTKVSYDQLVGWSLTEWGAKRFVKKYGDEYWIIRYITKKSVNKRTLYNREYLNKIKKKNSGKRQELSAGGQGV